MAEITNGQRTPAEIKKDLYNHTSLDDLYSYNPTICTIRELSKKNVTQYVAEGVAMIGELFEGSDVTNNEVGQLSIDSPIFGGSVVDLVPANEDYKADCEDGIFFTSLEIVDAVTYTLSEAKAAYLMQKLLPSIQMGLYPCVAMQWPSNAIYDEFEKYDEYRISHSAGTIVEVRRFRNRIFCTVMWNPDFVSSCGAEAFQKQASQSATLTLCNGLTIPPAWADVIDDVMVPIFEMHQDSWAMARLQNAAYPRIILDLAMSSGSIKIPFVDYMMENTTKLVQNMSATIAELSDADKGKETLEKHLGVEPDEDKEDDIVPEVEDIIDDDDSDVPIGTSEMMRRLHLMDEAVHDEDDFVCNETLADTVRDLIGET